MQKPKGVVEAALNCAEGSWPKRLPLHASDRMPSQTHLALLWSPELQTVKTNLKR